MSAHEIHDKEFNPYPIEYSLSVERDAVHMRAEINGIEHEPAQLLSIARDLIWLAGLYQDEAVRKAINSSDQQSRVEIPH